MPTRKRGLSRNVPLRAKTSLGRGQSELRRTPLKPVSARRAALLAASDPAVRSRPSSGPARPFPPEVAVVLDGRDRICQRDGSPRDLQRHHRRAKASGGSRRAHVQCPCNGVVLCRDCHVWVHANPEQARAEGWIVSQSVAEPGSAGVMRFSATGSGVTQWPSCDGEWLATADEAREAAMVP